MRADRLHVQDPSDEWRAEEQLRRDAIMQLLPRPHRPGLYTVPAEVGYLCAERDTVAGLPGLVVWSTTDDRQIFMAHSGGAWELADGALTQQIVGTCDEHAPRSDGGIRRMLDRMAS